MMTSLSNSNLRIREIRLEKGLTQTALADISGYAQSQIWRWEVGKECPSARVVYNLITALGVEPNQMFQGDWSE